MLVINNLTKSFGNSKLAVNNISLRVESGQICAFIGHNGAGKTTTLKAIAGILDYDKGEVIVNGRNVKEFKMQTKMDIGYLPDNPDLYEFLSGIEYLNFIANIYNIDKQTRQERIEAYAKRLKIYDDLASKIGSYSHGMKQKIALISLLIHKPKLYLLDEPFVGLDPVSSHELKKIMNEECSNGSAIFYSTHILEVAEKICSHIVIIREGKIMGQGEMNKVKGDKSLENLFLELDNE